MNVLIVFPKDSFKCGHLGFRGTADMSALLFLYEEKKTIRRRTCNHTVTVLRHPVTYLYTRIQTLHLQYCRK